MQYRIGIDLGGTKIEGVVLSDAADCTDAPRVRIPTPVQKGYDAIVEETAALILQLRRGLPQDTPVGVGMPGSITASGLVKNSNTTCLNGRDFRRELRARCEIPISFANDANCFALAEAKYGAGAGYSSVFGVIMGTGVGGGIVFHNEVHDGLHSIAGEWGHTSLWPDYSIPCYCGKRGCAEQFLSGPGVASMYTRRTGAVVTLKQMCEMAQDGDAVARECLDTLTDNFGRALSNVINILDPDVVVLGGGLSNISQLYLDGTRSIARYLFSDRLLTPILKNRLGDSAGVIGAALLRSAVEGNRS